MSSFGVARDLVIVAQFDPPNARIQYEEWRSNNSALLAELADDDIRIDTGRASGGDFVRVWLPPDATRLTSDEPFECQEYHWQGRQRDLVRATNDDGSVELLCPRCEQAHWSFPP